MLVYRVEHPCDDGHGPYQGRRCGANKSAWDLANHLSDAHRGRADRPTINEDTDWDFRWGEDVCAFETLESARDWFLGWIGELDKAGYLIAGYETPAVTQGESGRQIAFRRGDAKRVQTLPMSTLFKRGPSE